MRFNGFGSQFFFCLLCASFLTALLCAPLCAGISDRVAAYVDNEAITLTELEEKYAETAVLVPSVTREEVLNTMINRILLIREAKKIRLKSEGEDALLKEYMNLKIRAFIRIRDEEIKNFYDLHADDFQGKELDELREEIESYLIEQEMNKRVGEHIAELRGGACVKVQLIRAPHK